MKKFIKKIKKNNKKLFTRTLNPKNSDMASIIPTPTINFDAKGGSEDVIFDNDGTISSSNEKEMENKKKKYLIIITILIIRIR